MARWQRANTKFGGWRLVSRGRFIYVTRREEGGPWVAKAHGSESEYPTLYGAKMAMNAAAREACKCMVCWVERAMGGFDGPVVAAPRSGWRDPAQEDEARDSSICKSLAYLPDVVAGGGGTLVWRREGADEQT